MAPRSREGTIRYDGLRRRATSLGLGLRREYKTAKHPSAWTVCDRRGGTLAVLRSADEVEAFLTAYKPTTYGGSDGSISGSPKLA